MSVPKGFKQTEVGVIPEDWHLLELWQVADFLDGQRKPIKSSNREGMKGIYPYYGASGIIDYVNDYIFNDELVLLGEDGENILSRNLRLAFIVRGKIWVNNHAHVLKAKEGYSTAFLAEKLESLNYEQYNSGTAQPKLTKGTCAKIKIPLPPTRAEQTAIAAALSDMDALIEGVEKLLEKKRRIKQGAMQELLRPKDGWKLKKIKDIGDIITGGTPSTLIKEYWNGKIPWVTPTDITYKKDIYLTERKITTKGLSVVRKVPKNSLLVTCIASIGKNVVLRTDGACNQQINAVVPYEDFDVEFIYYLIENNKKKLLSNSGITATLILSKKKFSDLNFSFPGIKSEQTAIASILSDMDSEIEQLEIQLAKYRQLKTGMMQELLTGKKRLT